MKRRALERLSWQLAAREATLADRYLTPLTGLNALTAEQADHVSSYVALLHAEIEYGLELSVKMTLQQARDVTDRFQPHPVLLNAMAFYRSEVSARLGTADFLPKRAACVNDSSVLLHAWETLGASSFFNKVIADNHGAGLSYVESLFHPLGLVVSDKPFKRLEGRGVKQLGNLSSGKSVELTEFANLRGNAVHAGQYATLARLRQESAPDVRRRGEAAVVFFSSALRTIARCAW